MAVEQNADLAQREDGDHVDGEGLRPERLQLHHALLHHNGADQEADQRDDRHGAKADMVEMMHEGDGTEAPGLADHAPERGRDLAEKGGELDGVAPHAGQRLGHVIGQELQRLPLLDRRALDIAATPHLLDQDAEAFGRSGIARAQTALLPGGRRPLQKHGAGGIDLGDAGNIHFAGEVGRGRDRHAQALERRVEPGCLGDGPGACRHKPERRAPELDAEAGCAGLRRQDNLMVALEHLRA